MLQIQSGLLITFFKPNGFCVNLLTAELFVEKNAKYPTKARVVVAGWHISDKFISMPREEEFRSVPRAKRGKRFRRNASPKTGGKRSICEK